MKKNTILFIRYAVLISLGVFLGWLFFHSPGRSDEHAEVVEKDGQVQIWTCAMHPHIRMPEPGKCPICGMDLIPVGQSTDPTDPQAVHLSEDAAALANVSTSVVSKMSPVKEIRLYGKVQADERLIHNQTAHVAGRIEDLRVNFTGEKVEKGQVLALIYSPELVVAQQEMVEASKAKNLQPEIYESAKEKLRHWKLTEDQINQIEMTGMVQHDVEVISNTTGVVTLKLVNTGDHVNEGAVLYTVADLSKVWILFDAYESDLQFINTGDKINFTVQAMPGTNYSGIIEFIDPVIDPVTRVAKVRLETNNPYGRLKPEMFVTGIARSGLDEFRNMLVIPKSAVLWTGVRSIVYVKQSDSDELIFKMREVELGPEVGDNFVINEGLSAGEEIATRGTFSIDAAAQLEGKTSMMNLNKSPENVADETNMDFIKQFGMIVEKYIILKDAFIDGNVKKVNQSAQNFQKSITAADINLLTGESRANWMQYRTEINRHADRIISDGNIESQRKSFSSLTDEMYKSVKAFGTTGKTVYYQFCPMAFDNKGAYWLSTTADIRNPYFGDQMLTCGETRETLN